MKEGSPENASNAAERGSGRRKKRGFEAQFRSWRIRNRPARSQCAGFATAGSDSGRGNPGKRAARGNGIVRRLATGMQRKNGVIALSANFLVFRVSQATCSENMQKEEK